MVKGRKASTKVKKINIKESGVTDFAFFCPRHLLLSPRYEQSPLPRPPKPARARAEEESKQNPFLPLSRPPVAVSLCLLHVSLCLIHAPFDAWRSSLMMDDEM